MGLEICVLEALDDVFDELPETLTNVAGTPGENETDEDVVSPEVTEELNMLGRPYTALTTKTTTAQANTQARAGTLMAHHPVWVGHHTGGSRSKPTVHTCPLRW